MRAHVRRHTNQVPRFVSVCSAVDTRELSASVSCLLLSSASPKSASRTRRSSPDSNLQGRVEGAARAAGRRESERAHEGAGAAQSQRVRTSGRERRRSTSGVRARSRA